MTEEFFSITTFEPTHNVHVEASKSPKLCLTQCLFSDLVYRHFEGRSGKRKTGSSLRLQLLKACSAMLTHIEKKYSVPNLRVDFAIKEKPCAVELPAHRGRKARDSERKKLLCC